MSLSAIAKLPRLHASAADEQGVESVWKRHRSTRRSKRPGEIRHALANYLLVEAADDYRIVFALPELDPAFSESSFSTR